MNSGHHCWCMAKENPFEGSYGASQTLWKRTVGNAKRRTRGLSLSPRALANWFQSLSSHSDCCYHRLSVATVLRSYSCQRPLEEKAAGWTCKFSAREEFLREHRNNRRLAHTGVEPTSSKQALTAHQLNAAMRGIYPQACRPKCRVIRFPSRSVHQTLGHAPLQPGTFCERLSIGWFWHACWTRPLLRNQLRYVSFEGVKITCI